MVVVNTYLIAKAMRGSRKFCQRGSNFDNVFLSPRFFKKAKGILLSPPSVCPSVRPLCYHLLNHWTKLNQIRCVSYSHKRGAQRKKKFWAPPPGALGRGQKVKYHLISITKSISKIFIPNFVCVLTNERYKTYQTDFYSVACVMPQGWDLGVLRGQNQIPSCCLSVMLSPPKPLDEIKPNLVCEILT